MALIKSANGFCKLSHVLLFAIYVCVMLVFVYIFICLCVFTCPLCLQCQMCWPMLCVLPHFLWDSVSPVYLLETTHPWEQHKICYTWPLDWPLLSIPFNSLSKCGWKENGKMTASCIRSESYFCFVCHDLTIESVSLILPLCSLHLKLYLYLILKSTECRKLKFSNYHMCLMFIGII